jgi:hypothetical protein
MKQQLRLSYVAVLAAIMILGSTLANAKSKYICDEPQPGGQVQLRQHMWIGIQAVLCRHPEIREWRKRQAGNSEREGQSVLLRKGRHVGRVDYL